MTESNVNIEEPSDALLDARAQTRLASNLALLSVTLCLWAPCMCYLPCILALPLGVGAVHTARSPKIEFPDDDAVSGLSDFATFAGIIAIVFSLLWLGLILMYLLFYVALIGIAIVANL